jgi:hypothetical protein
MLVDGYDYIILGTVLGVGSAFFFAKPYVFPSFPDEAAQTFVSTNPFQVRNAITQRYEATAGAIWAAASLLALVIGTVRTTRHGQIGFLIGSWIAILLVLGACAVVWLITLGIANWLSRRAYIPQMIAIQRELFERDSFVITHEGRYPDEVERGIESPSEYRENRLTDAIRNIDRIGRLIDLPRAPGEDSVQNLCRLRAFLSDGGQ